MKIVVDCGHGLDGQPNSGAHGLVSESTEVRVIGKKVIAYLKQLGHTVIDITYDRPRSNSESINTRVSRERAANADLTVSIHLNAGGGHGVEIFTYNAKAHPQAQRVLNNIVKLGYRNRGIKKGNHLAMVGKTKATAMLVECFFVDSKEDTERYKKNKDAMARAIAEGVTGQSLSASKPSKPTVNKPKGDDVKMTEKQVIALIEKMIRPSSEEKETNHWAEENYISLQKKGVEIHDKRYGDLITRAEVFALIDRAVK